MTDLVQCFQSYVHVGRGDAVHRPGDAWRLPYTTFARYFGVDVLVLLQNEFAWMGRGDAQYRCFKLAGKLRKAAHKAAPGSAGFQPALTEERFRRMPPGWRRSQAKATSLSQQYWGDAMHRPGDAWRLPYGAINHLFCKMVLVHNRSSA